MTHRRYLIAASGVVAFAAGLRLFAIGFWRQLIFDENYYVKDAISLRHFGAELAWPKGASASIEQGTVPQPLNEPEMISHPPLGKWLISLGFDIFGETNPIGWRISAAVAGILCVILVMSIARLMFDSQRISLLAGVLMAVDGTAVLMSRVALLDGFLALFVLLAWWCFLRSRHSPAAGLWLLATGVSLGAATAVKWSGLWFALALTVYAVVTNRRRFDAFWRLSLPAVITYLASWGAWFAGSVGLDRNPQDNPAAAFWRLHLNMLEYNLHYVSVHPSVSTPLEWLTLAKPTLLMVDPHSTASANCGIQQNCKLIISSLGNPLIWWLGLVALIVLAIWRIRGLEKRATLLLLGFAAGWAPWLLFASRTAFHFYVIAFEGFLVIALAWWLAKLSNRRQLLVMAAIVALSFVFLPYQLGTAQPDWYWQVTRWLPNWQ